MLDMQVNFWLALGVLLVIMLSAGWLIGRLVRRVEMLTREGLRLQNAAIENNNAWEKGQADMQEVYENQILDLDDTIVALTISKDYFEGTMNAFIIKVMELETQHAMHVDHCLPVLSEIRKEFAPDGDDTD